MTPENAKKLLPIITAYAEGNVIQYNCGSPENPDWEDRQKHLFTLDPGYYRIKPCHHPDTWFDVSDKLLPPPHGKWVAPELTREQVPEGHRPYLYGEKLRKGDPLYSDIGYRNNVDQFTGENAEELLKGHPWWAFTREPLPPAPEPVLMTVDDLPPIVWILDPAGNWSLIYAVRKDGELETHFNVATIPWLHEHGFHWSTDRKNPQSFLKP